MNDLKALLDARGITIIDFAKKTGLPVSNVRRLCTDENYKTCTKKTQQKLADGLGITIRELVEGGDPMKNKILYSEISKTVEKLCVLLRKTSPDPLFLDIAIFTRDKVVSDGKEIPDYYSFRVCKADEEFEADAPLINESSRVFYSFDKEEGEKVHKIMPYRREVREE